ncbi:hypothetical protein BT96DRAFT_1027693 [Gymnopus androsaceus JB14]|uniref:Uncharacterized protein n=1 Tax=Gymnopus androsaceus JB14 TaxID=1447944 RepID=A0A6A4GA28_9AGAR|nr:hypothetical protein BT96DRAFT_1027693 [Gymnopus androsaceus JB14]
MSSPWPDVMMRSFFVAVTAQLPPTTAHGVDDSAVVVLVCIKSTPVFALEVKPIDDFHRNSKREQADIQLRRCFGVMSDIETPVLHGVIAFGTKLAFYTYDKNKRRIEPRRITPDSDEPVDTVAPKEWWSYDITEQAGADKFRGGCGGSQGDVRIPLIMVNHAF